MENNLGDEFEYEIINSHIREILAEDGTVKRFGACLALFQISLTSAMKLRGINPIIVKDAWDLLEKLKTDLEYYLIEEEEEALDEGISSMLKILEDHKIIKTIRIPKERNDDGI